MLLALLTILAADHKIPPGSGGNGWKLLLQKGEIYGHSDAGDYALGAPVSNGDCLVSDSTTATGLKWDACGSGGGDGGGAPTNATYLTQACTGGLSAEQCMSALATGITINTTTTGVQSIYAGGSCGANTFVTSTNASGVLTCTQPSFSNISGSATDGQIPNNITVDLATLASTATALASNPSDCTAGQYATTIAASGNLTCAQPAFSELSGTATDGQIPNTITIDLATAATALASNPTDCSAGQYATTIAASGNLTCAQPAFSGLSGTATDAQIPDSITINNASIAAVAVALVADPADCASNQFAHTINASGTLTCSAVNFTQLAGTATDAQIPNTITIDTATALTTNPADCASNRYATTIAANGDLTCAQVDLSAGVTGTLPFANGGNGITRLGGDVGVAVNASYVTVFTVTGAAIGNSKNVSLDFRVVYIATVNTVGMQFRVSSADTGYVGNCTFITWGIAGTAASATGIETDIIAIAAVPADTAAAAACAATPCIVDVECSLTSDANAGDVLLEAQLETGTSSAPIKAGSSFYRLITN